MRQSSLTVQVYFLFVYFYLKNITKSYLANFTETASDTTLVELELLKDELKG